MTTGANWRPLSFEKCIKFTLQEQCQPTRQFLSNPQSIVQNLSIQVPPFRDAPHLEH